MSISECKLDTLDIHVSTKCWVYIALFTYGVPRKDAKAAKLTMTFALLLAQGRGFTCV